MNPKTKWNQWLWTGIILTTGPLWGLVGTVVGMIRAFGSLAESGEPGSEQLAQDISLALTTTFAGLIVFPFGVGLLVFSLLKLQQLKNTPPPLGGE